MLGAYVTELGPADNIHVGEVAVPCPSADEVLVRVDAVAVNHVDTYVRSGRYSTVVNFPLIVGRDLVGTVVDDQRGISAGQRVWCNSLGYGGRQGACAEFAAVPRSRLYPLPEGVDEIEALAVLHPASTAYLGLYRDARISANATVVVHGSGGALGSAVVQLASAAGARVIGVDRGTNTEWALACGAHAALDRDADNLTEQLSRMVEGGIDIFWDTTGRVDMSQVLPLLAPKGQVILTAGLSATAELRFGALYTRDAVVRGFAISNATSADLADAAGAINALLADNRIRPRQVILFPMSDAAAAHRAQEERRFPCARLIVLVRERRWRIGNR